MCAGQCELEYSIEILSIAVLPFDTVMFDM